MTFIVACTGVAGFLASVALLHLGVDAMWIRYPLAVGISYGVFLLLLRLWIVHQQRSPEVLDVSELVSVGDDFADVGSRGVVSNSRRSEGWDWADWFWGVDGDEGVVVLAVLVALVAGVLAAGCIVVSAPALLGEVFLDAVAITALRRRMVGVAEQHWTWAALRRTAVPFLVVAVILSVVGGVVQHVGGRG